MMDDAKHPGTRTAHTGSTSGSTVDEEGSSNSFTVSFIDYVPPPPPSLPPPAKYKLWLLVLILVYFAVWFAEQGNALNGLRFSGYLNFHAAQFLLLLVIVFCLTYSTLDLLVLGLTVKIGEHTYGVEPWLKQERIKWVHKHENPFVELLAVVVTSFEEGFEIFDIGPTNSHDEPAKGTKEESSGTFECDEGGCHVILKIDHCIKLDRIEDYKAWQEKTKRRVMTQPGYVRAVSHCGGNGLVSIYLTFESIDTLNDWMTSPAREKLISELKPLLQVDDVVQLVQTRHLPDAFTDLLTKQGQSVPKLLPKKWKVWWLTTCGLFFTLLISEEVLPYYFEIWGLADEHPRLQSFVASIFNTWFNSFVMTPFLMMIFFRWVRRKESEVTNKEPWRTLNEGIDSIWLKLLVTASFFGGCAISWSLQ